jgi:acylpyruvate hydrolase
MCIGRNYADHIKELSSATPKQPFFFLKPPSSILLPGAGPVLRPRGVNMHYEVELGLIMGKTIRDLHPEDTKSAMDAIEGTTNAIHGARCITIRGSIELTSEIQATFLLSI